MIFDSELPLPELHPVAGDPVATVRRGTLEHDEHMIPMSLRMGRRRVERDLARLVYDGIGALEVKAGREIVVEAAPGASGEQLRAMILGPGLAFLLHQRGHLALHASGILMAGRAHLFLGQPGAGKSTLAAACRRAGMTVLTDDLAAIEIAAGSPVLHPGVPMLKLTPAAATFLGEEDRAVVPLGFARQKRGRPIEPAGERPFPLAAIHVLAEGRRVERERIASLDAIAELVRHSFLARVLLDSGTAGEHLGQCARVVSGVPIDRLRRPRDLTRLDEAVRIVAQDPA
ncbi:MAG TPA: hypothetical protein VGQ47_01340 [Candidatus Limnocylindrales bacterium]|nr:hypothetical protein [Candidatus Limnocylindrales bacterium]